MMAIDNEHKIKLLCDKYIKYLFIACAFFMTVIIFSIILFIGNQGLMTFKDVGVIEFFFSSKWDPWAGEYGAASFIVGSITVTLLTIIIGGPLGLAGAIFMAKIAPKWVRELMRPATDLYVAIPSVVYGYIGLTLFIPFFRDIFGVTTGFGVFVAGVILAIMILPTIISISTDALGGVPRELEEGSLALGATYWQTMWHIVLPTAMPGIATAIVLGMARAIGETMAVQMVIGNTPQLPKSIFSPTSTLPSEIVVEMGNTPFGSAWGNSLFLMALVLLIISLLLILLVRKISAGKEVRA